MNDQRRAMIRFAASFLRQAHGLVAEAAADQAAYHAALTPELRAKRLGQRAARVARELAETRDRIARDIATLEAASR